MSILLLYPIFAKGTLLEIIAYGRQIKVLTLKKVKTTDDSAVRRCGISQHNVNYHSIT